MQTKMQEREERMKRINRALLLIPDKLLKYSDERLFSLGLISLEKIQKSKESLIERFKKIHGDDLYGYSKTEYINSTTPVEIICKDHGSFFQTPQLHLSGSGCRKCGRLRTGIKTEDIILKFKKVHSDKYGYEKVKYVFGEKVEITCEEHGPFFQLPEAHLRGQGCPDCAIIQKTLKRKNEYSNALIARLKKIHNNRYDYSKTVFLGASKKIEIICKEHGSFFKICSLHISGKGCPYCIPRGQNYEKSRLG